MEQKNEKIKHKQKKQGLIRDIINGTILTHEGFIRQLPFILFLTFLGIIYIANRYHEEKIVRKISKLQSEIKNLKSEQISITSELMLKSKPSEITKIVAQKGLKLKEPSEPLKKIVLKEK